jgi:hypothetical protein
LCQARAAVSRFKGEGEFDMKIIYCLAIVLLAYGLLAATPQATSPGSVAARPTPTPTPVAPAKQSVAVVTPTPTATPTPLSTVKQSGAVVTATPTPLSPAKQSIAVVTPTPKATPTPVSTVKQSGAVVAATPTPPKALQTAPAGVAARPTPTPAAASPSIGSIALSNTPFHSPDQFDFGEVWDGDLARKTFHITANASGFITVDIPAGPFHVSEYREMGKATGGSKNMGTGKGPIVPIQPVKVRYPYPDGRTGPLQWKVEPDTDVQIDVVFQPHFKFGGEMAGQKSASMKVSGPGPKLNWTLAVPLRGMFDGVKISALMTADQKEVFGVQQNDEGAYVNVTITGLGTPVQGTIKAGGTLPKGVSVEPQVVTVPAKFSLKVPVWIAFGAVRPGVQQPLELVFESSNGASKTQLLLTILPNADFEMNSGNRGDCGVSRASLSLQITPPSQSKTKRTLGRRGWVFLGWNFDVADTRYVEMTAQSGGVVLFAPQTFVLPVRVSDETRQNSVYLEEFDVTAEDWARIMQGPTLFGCRQFVVSKRGGTVPSGETKWEAGVQGLKF